MTILAEDPTAAAVLEAVPCYPIPPSGQSPAIVELRGARAGHGIVVGCDRVMLVVRRPWIAVDVAITEEITAHLPYGRSGKSSAHLRCGLIPGILLDEILDHFRRALPDEAAAFIVWNETTQMFAVDYPTIDEATPSRLVYRTPTLAADCHLVCDLHSHGRGRAFFSSTDDADDLHATKIAVVVGRLDLPGGPEIAARLCVGGMFVTLPNSPFAGGDDDA